MNSSSIRLSNVFLNIIFIILCIMCIFPVLLVIGISFSSESSIVNYGYRVIPKQLSLEAYKYIFTSKDTILRAYGLTIFTTVTGTILNVLIVSLFAYPLSRKDFRFRRFFTFFVFFTMLFNAGMVPWYIICTQVLKIQNTVFALILPYLMDVWNVIVMRTFFSTTIPDSLIESAKIDGSGEFRIFFTIVIPLSLPGLATIGLFSTLRYWNDWWLPLMLTSKPELYNLQFLLQNLISNIQMLTESSKYMGGAYSELLKIPVESARMALCIVALGPIVLAYPFFQKYFISGLTIGSIKG